MSLPRPHEHPHVQGAPTAPAPDPEQLVRDRGDEDLPEHVVDTSSRHQDGITRCPSCGGTDIRYVIENKGLTCGYCRSTWNEPNAEDLFALNSAIADLHGVVIASGSRRITEAQAVVTVKCQGCGADVVISTADANHARCHWCRQTLLLNQQIPNGLVPDAVLPFTVTREEAIAQIREFAGNRRFFANRTFLREFVPDNVMAVYLPYMVVDANLTARVEGRGEITTRRWTETHGSGENKRTVTYYDADVYQVGRQFTMHVDDLSIVSSGRYDMQDSSRATNNILNAILPYDIPEAVAYNGYYMVGFTSERRDLEIEDLDASIDDKLLSIARAQAGRTIQQYGRGVRWEREGEMVVGSRWISVYVPVWLYSYAHSAAHQQGLVHYIAVNGRTGKTMGSVPVSHARIGCVSGLVGLLVTVMTLLVFIGGML